MNPHGPMSRYTSERDTFSQASFPQWNPASRQYTPPSLDELKWKLIRFKIPEIGYSYTIDIRDCTSGLQVFEKALRKAKGTISCHADNVIDDDEGLRMYGWGFYMADRDNGVPLTSAQLLAICYASPNDPTRSGLTLKGVSGRRSLALFRSNSLSSFSTTTTLVAQP